MELLVMNPMSSTSAAESQTRKRSKQVTDLLTFFENLEKRRSVVAKKSNIEERNKYYGEKTIQSSASIVRSGFTRAAQKGGKVLCKRK